VERAVVYWLKAGRTGRWRASAATEAAVLLRRGLDQLAGLPDGPGRPSAGTGPAKSRFGLALMAIKGYSAARGGRGLSPGAPARARRTGLTGPNTSGRLFLGQSSFHRVRGEHRQALALAEQLEKNRAKRATMSRAQLVGRLANGRTRLFLGDFVTARAFPGAVVTVSPIRRIAARDRRRIPTP